jgi:hypothetical protein
MARIIDPSAQERPVARQGGSISRLVAKGPSEVPGKALMQLGEDISAGSQEIYRAQKIEEERINTLRAQDASTQLNTRRMDLTLSEDEGFSRLKGADAVTRPIVQEYGKRFEDAERQIASTLTNDRQREMFKARAGIARLQYDEDMYRHLAKEGDVYAKQVYDGAVAQAQQEATTRWDSPNAIATSLATIRSMVQNRAERYGWADEYREAVMLEESGKVHASVIGQALASNDYRYAESWYKTYKDQIPATTAKVLQKAVEDGTQKDLTARFNTTFLSQRENRQGLLALEKEVLTSPLDETRKNIVHGRILNRLDALDVRAERERLQQERKIGKLINDANGNTLAGMPSTIEQLVPIYEAAKGTDLEPEARQMVSIANATGTFSKLAPLEQANQITAAEAQIRKDPGKFDRRVLDAWKQIHERQGDLLKKDPITFAVRQGIAEPAPLDLSQPVQAADGLAERFAIARSMTAKYGAPLRPLTEPEQQLVSRAVAGAGWKERREYLGQMFQASRGDVQGYSGIMAQLAADHPVTALAGEFAAKGRSQASDAMLQGEAILRPSTKADGKPEGGSLVPMPPEQDLRREFDREIQNAYAGLPETRNVMYQATRSIYAKLQSDAGDKDTKAPDLTRLRQAIELATGGVEKYRGKYTPLPYGMPIGEFKDQMKRRTDDIEVSGVLPEGITAKTLRDLPLEPAGDGRYVFRSGDGIMFDKNGRQILLDFNQSAAFRPSGYDFVAQEPATAPKKPGTLDNIKGGPKPKKPTRGPETAPPAGVRG